MPPGLSLREEKHGAAEVCSIHPTGGVTLEFEGQVAGATTKVSDARTRALQDMTQSLGRGSPPRQVSTERKEMVQEIVTRRDCRKHFAQGAGSRFAGLRRTSMACREMGVGGVLHVSHPAALRGKQLRRGAWELGLKL